MKECYSIKLKPGAIPFAITSPRRVPIPLLNQTKPELERMVEEKVITPVLKPTEWCAPVVIVPKSDGKETIVTTDASSYGLGATICKNQADGRRSVIAYVSWTLTPTESRYAQIEKEALAIVWGCEKFKDYLTGMHFKIKTDQKPLIPIVVYQGNGAAKPPFHLSPELSCFPPPLSLVVFPPASSGV
ncbi:hypothetical protein AVEN_53809-1 [Araneus ventricosus]|uniref:Reverse transcriptase RNase H-like domain-containing protein n=1 Tax=Araneus ventricosus TaxID=182803 RepID=A0A4Y2R098_ARAVE|nr:hypothetical protein AVEN_53809-1 [Araneus ventricosus]